MDYHFNYTDFSMSGFLYQHLLHFYKPILLFYNSMYEITAHCHQFGGFDSQQISFASTDRNLSRLRDSRERYGCRTFVYREQSRKTSQEKRFLTKQCFSGKQAGTEKEDNLLYSGMVLITQVQQEDNSVRKPRILVGQSLHTCLRPQGSEGLAGRESRWEAWCLEELGPH